MRMDIDQPRNDQLASRINRVRRFTGNVRVDRGDAPCRDGDVANAVETKRRIDHSPAPDQEVIFLPGQQTAVRAKHRGTRGSRQTLAAAQHVRSCYRTGSAPISLYRYADAITPPWKLPRSSFSSGACAFSSGKPTPKSTHGRPSSSWNVDTTGIDPPSRLNTGL